MRLFANIVLQIPLKMRKNWKRFLSPVYSLNLKNIILLLNRGWFVFFFWNGHIRNVVSTLSNVVQFNIEIHNFVSTLLNVVDFNVDVRILVSMLIWRCATSRRHINLKATLSRRWNVCWDSTICKFTNKKFVST